MLKLQVKSRFEHLLDAIIDLIITAKDFFLFKHVTLSEGFLFFWYLFRAIWFLFVGVENANYSYYVNDNVLTTIHLCLSLLHLVGFFFKKAEVRMIALYGYAIILFILTGLAVYSRTSAPAVPSLIPLALWAVFLIVRLAKDDKTKTQNE